MRNFVGCLQEVTVASHYSHPRYEHRFVADGLYFECSVFVNGKHASGRGLSKKTAKQNAANCWLSEHFVHRCELSVCVLCDLKEKWGL